VSKEINEVCLIEQTFVETNSIIVQKIIPSHYDKIQEFFKFKIPIFRVFNCRL